ncbi:MAG: SH3 domain-containing protein [Helicobacteraceae bacterium]|jgi:hypothetical protein|nr:SH3 domain-containing protein [Helicobacteraceae bacterium]
MILRKTAIFILLSFLNCAGVVYSQVFYSQNTPTYKSPIVGYVTAKKGLTIRSCPSISCDKTGTLLYGDRIILIGRSENQEEIDGITEYWYKLEWQHSFAWIFGGFLSNAMPKDTPPVLGRWRIENQDARYYWNFSPDGYAVHGNPLSGGGLIYGGSSFVGVWTLRGDNLIIKAEHFQTQWGEISNRRDTIKIVITAIDRDRIIFRFSDGLEHILIRDNAP